MSWRSRTVSCGPGHAADREDGRAACGGVLESAGESLDQLRDLGPALRAQLGEEEGAAEDERAVCKKRSSERAVSIA